MQKTVLLLLLVIPMSYFYMYLGAGSFNDRALNRDLEALCAKVAKVQPRLPDGRSLFFRMQGLLSFHF